MFESIDWQGKYDDAVAELRRYDETARGLLDRALAVAWEKNVALTVLAAGYHPFHAAGQQLVDRITADLESGVLTTEGVGRRETVWRYASALGVDTDLTPILVDVEGGNP